MKSFSIKNYKNLPDLRLENLSRINLIIGENNVGKSALLEALALHISDGSFLAIRDILATRGENFKFREYSNKAIENEIESYCSLFTGWSFEGFLREGIVLTSENQEGLSERIVIKLNKFQNRLRTNDDGYSYPEPVLMDPSTPMTPSINLSLSISNGNFNRNYDLNSGPRIITPEELKKYEFVKTSQFVRSRNAELFDNIALTSLEGEIIKTLKIIDPRIEKINFLKNSVGATENERVPYVVLQNDTRKYRLSSMGDGINRILTIILSLLNSKGGVLLIDEFENGLHYTVQSQLWEMIGELAEKLDVQVFATTHSNDCIRSFARTLKKDVGLVIRLQHMKKGISPVYFNDYNEVLFALDNDIDIR